MFIRSFLCLLLLLRSFGAGAGGDTTRVNELNRQAWEMRHSHLDSAILLARQSLGLIREISAQDKVLSKWKTRATAQSYFYLGSFYNQKGSDSLAQSYIEKALALSKKINDRRGISVATGGLGLLYMNQGDFPKALQHYFEALQIDEEIGHKEGILTRLGNIGVVYDFQKNYDKALEYYSRALKMAEELKRTNSISIQYCNIGVIYYEKGELGKAQEYFLKALEMDRARGNKNGIARNLNNLASLYRDRKDYETALQYFKEALKAAEEQGNTDHISSMSGDVGNTYMLMGNYPMAEQFLKRAVTLSREIKSLPGISDIEAALSELYTRWGRHREALEHYKAHIAARDSVFNLENVEKNVRLELNYEFEKKEAVKKALYEKQLQLLEAGNRSQAQFRIFLFIVIGLILLMLLVLKRAYDNKTRLAAVLKTESERKEILLQEVHHRVNNNLQIISSLLTLQSNASDNEVLKEYLKESQQRIQSLSALHELLYGQDESPEVNIEEYLGKVLSFHREVLHSKPFQAEITLRAPAVRVLAKTALPVALIVNELVTNAIKYAFSPGDQGRIEVVLEQNQAKNDIFVLRVNDNGKGLPASTGRESLGLRLVNMLAKQMKAVLKQSGPPGTSFELAFSVMP